MNQKRNFFSTIAKVAILVLVAPFISLVKAQRPFSECTIPGDQDVLGLGVRLGFYFQLFSNLLLGTICPSDAAKAFLPNLYFIIALICATIYSSAKENFPPGSIIACTWYPVLAYVALLPFLLHRLPNELRSSQVVAMAGVVAAASCFTMWFWYKGLDEIHVDQCMEPRVFFFANFSALGNIRTLFKIITSLVTLLALASGYSVFWFETICLSRIPPGALPQPPYVPQRRKLVFVLGLIWLAGGIVASELQLKWNHVSGVNSIETTGQIIPLALGVLSMFQTLLVFRFVFQRDWLVKFKGAVKERMVRLRSRLRGKDGNATSSPPVELDQV